MGLVLIMGRFITRKPKPTPVDRKPKWIMSRPEQRESMDDIITLANATSVRKRNGAKPAAVVPTTWLHPATSLPEHLAEPAPVSTWSTRKQREQAALRRLAGFTR